MEKTTNQNPPPEVAQKTMDILTFLQTANTKNMHLHDVYICFASIQCTLWTKMNEKKCYSLLKFIMKCCVLYCFYYFFLIVKKIKSYNYKLGYLNVSKFALKWRLYSKNMWTPGTILGHYTRQSSYSSSIDGAPTTKPSWVLTKSTESIDLSSTVFIIIPSWSYNVTNLLLKAYVTVHFRRPF